MSWAKARSNVCVRLGIGLCMSMARLRVSFMVRFMVRVGVSLG